MGLRLFLILAPLLYIASASYPRDDDDDLVGWNPRPTKKVIIYAPNGRNFVKNTINVKDGAVSFHQGGDDSGEDFNDGAESYRSGAKKKKNSKRKGKAQSKGSKKKMRRSFTYRDEDPIHASNELIARSLLYNDDAVGKEAAPLDDIDSDDTDHVAEKLNDHPYLQESMNYRSPTLVKRRTILDDPGLFDSDDVALEYYNKRRRLHDGLLGASGKNTKRVHNMHRGDHPPGYHDTELPYDDDESMPPYHDYHMQMARSRKIKKNSNKDELSFRWNHKIVPPAFMFG